MTELWEHRLCADSPRPVGREAREFLLFCGASGVPYYSVRASGKGVPLERLISSAFRERFVQEPELLGPGPEALAAPGSWEAKAML